MAANRSSQLIFPFESANSQQTTSTTLSSAQTFRALPQTNQFSEASPFLYLFPEESAAHPHFRSAEEAEKFVDYAFFCQAVMPRGSGSGFDPSDTRSPARHFLENDTPSLQNIPLQEYISLDHSDNLSVMSFHTTSQTQGGRKGLFAVEPSPLNLDHFLADTPLLKSNQNKDLKTACCKGPENFKLFLTSPEWQIWALDNMKRLGRAVGDWPKDINGADVIVIKPGPVSKTKQEQLTQETGMGWFRKMIFDRRCFEVFVSEADLRLISFYSTFRFVAKSEEEKDELFQAVAGMMTSLWALKTLGYMRTHQKEEISKNEQKQKKIFTWAINKLEAEDPELADLARSLSTSGNCPARSPRGQKIQKRKDKVKPQNKLKKRFEKPEPKLNGINFNQSTYSAWHDRPELKQKILSILRGASDQELIEMLTEDVFGEVQAAINNFKSIKSKLPGRPSASQLDQWRPKVPGGNQSGIEYSASLQMFFQTLFPKDAPSTTLDAYYTRIAMNSSRSVTSRHTWTYNSLKDAIAHCEEQIMSPRQAKVVERSPRNPGKKWSKFLMEVPEMNLQGALTMAQQTQLITECQMGLLCYRLESMLNK